MSHFKLIAIVLASLMLSSCCTPFTQSFCCAPNECSQAKEGFDRYDVVIKALEVYKNDNGTYPDTLELLIPKYIKAIPYNELDELEYTSNKNTYELSFRYYGPGINVCTFLSETQKWDCSGYY